MTGPTQEEEARTRIARALIDAEAGVANVWRTLDEAALQTLASDAPVLAGSVPWALGRLAAQLVSHGRAAARLEAIRMLVLVGDHSKDQVQEILQRLTKEDRAANVRKAADRALLLVARPLAAASTELNVEDWEWAPTVAEPTRVHLALDEHHSTSPL
jgi:hypothetical protein